MLFLNNKLYEHILLSNDLLWIKADIVPPVIVKTCDEEISQRRHRFSKILFSFIT